MGSTPLTPAQARQQNNRSTDGRYAQTPGADQGDGALSQSVYGQTGMADGRRNPATHIEGMSTTIAKIAEDKAWFATAHGLPNGNSYAAIGIAGEITLAADVLRQAGWELTHDALADVSSDLHRMAAHLESTLSVDGDSMPGTGLNTRIRGLIRTAIEHTPPIAGGDEGYQLWRAQVYGKAQMFTEVFAEALTAVCGPNPAQEWDAPSTHNQAA